MNSKSAFLRTQTVVRRAAFAAFSYAAISGVFSPLTPALAASSKSYVVNWFYMANYYGGEADCPDGLNPPAIDFYRRDFLRMGKSKEEVDKLLEGYPGDGDGGNTSWRPVAMVRGNGKDDVFTNPTTEPDPGLKEVKGRFAYGFNLDGRGAVSPSSFEEPETHERGVNNQLYRALGCIRSFRGGAEAGDTAGAGARPAYPEYVWDVLRNVMSAWLVTITSNDGKDGDASVVIDRAREKITRDASGVNVRSDMTYHIDPTPRGHNVLRGTIKDGVFTSSEPADVNILADSFGLAADLHFFKARLRLKLNADGTIKGVIGGYEPWYPIYWADASRATGTEYAYSQDAIAMYYGLKRLADYMPDPKTGENQAISAAYMFEAVPAFAVDLKPVAQASARTFQVP